jgi:hypothetical protein
MTTTDFRFLAPAAQEGLTSGLPQCDADLTSVVWGATRYAVGRVDGELCDQRLDDAESPTALGSEAIVFVHMNGS